MKKRILLVEDEINLAKGLCLNFELEGYEVQWATSLCDARKQLMKGLPDLMVLDLMLPDGHGLDLLQEVKRQDFRQPVMILTACAADEDRITGLSLGAEDYVAKPFNLSELMLRIRGMLQRGDWYRPSTEEIFQIGKAQIDPSRSLLEREGASYLMTERELSLLMHLFRKQGQVVSREELLVDVWGYAPDTQTRTVDIFISRLRRMLGDDPEAPAYLQTLRGQGYRLASPGR